MAEERREASEIAGQARATLIVLTALAVALVLDVAVLVWSELRESPSFSPLDYDGPQTVTSRVRILSGAPATHLGDTVNVTATKCSDADVALIVVVAWRPVDPRGTTIQTDEHASSREAGCDTSRFQNEIPAEVETVVRRQHARGYAAPLWQITGVETPYTEDGTEGSPETWTTEPFAIVP